MTLYDEIVAAGIAWDSYESDLYILVCPESNAILRRLQISATAFKDQNGRYWYDVSFAYTPWWDERIARKKSNALLKEEAMKAQNNP